MLQWREAEALLLAPHTFSVLRQLPELQQLVSFTAVAAIKSAGQTRHEHIAAQAAEELFPASYEDSNDVLDLMQHCAAFKDFENVAAGDQTVLLEALTPQLRLALAAEVAIGMLCPE